MNEVFVIGKIVNKIEYKFIVNSKRNTAIAIFNIETKENGDLFPHLFIYMY